MLDGIDCVRNEDGGDSLSWLPTAFPASVRIVVSATQTSARGTNHLRCCKWVHRKPFVFDDEYVLLRVSCVCRSAHCAVVVADTSNLC